MRRAGAHVAHRTGRALGLIGELEIRDFAREDQAAVRSLILEGLRGHFGDAFDASFNGDLDDIAASYVARGCFLIATIEGAIVGTGALVLEDAESARVVRMSTAAPHRRTGVGSAVLTALVKRARDAACERVALATNTGWADAIAFYQAFGFTETVRSDAGVSFELRL